MIHWFWLVPAAMIGGSIGIAIMAVFAINTEEDDE